MKTTPYARSLAVVTACLLVGSMLTALPAQSPRAAPGTARVITAPLPTEPDDYDVLAATGDWIWAMLPGDSTVDNTSLSKDGGRTWTRLGMMPESSHYVAGAGRLAYFGGDDGLGVPYFFYPTDIDNGDWQELWSVAAAGTKAMLASNLYLVRSAHDDNVRVRFATLPKKLAKPTQRYSFTADSAYLIRLTHTAGSADYASVVDVRTAKSVGRLTLPSTAQHQVSGSAVYSLTATKAGLQLCRQPLPSGNRHLLDGHRWRPAQGERDAVPVRRQCDRAPHPQGGPAARVGHRHGHPGGASGRHDFVAAGRHR